MRIIAISVLGAAALLSSAANAAPLSPTGAGAQETSTAEQVRLVCDEYGRCYRSRGRRYVQRGYDDGYSSGHQSYGYYGGGQRHYGGGQGYYGGGQGYYGGGPSIGFSFGNRGW